jgi:short-subunit dehydrogenase
MLLPQASKAAVLNFAETLRMELGDEVGVTVATPGWIESEMTKGKHLSKEGRLEVDQDTRDVGCTIDRTLVSVMLSKSPHL